MQTIPSTQSRKTTPARMTLAMVVLTSILFALLGASAPASAFEAGDVFWASDSCGTPCGLFDITSGGTINAGDMVAATADSAGQIAWSTDLQTLYLSVFSSNEVIAISNAGAISTFATGLAGPTGLLRLENGTLLAVSYGSRAVYDITAGGDFSNATPFATGFTSPRNLLQRSNGTVLLADQGARRVFDITSGGDSSGVPGFAYGIPSNGPHDLAEDASGHLYASTRGSVYRITGGGDFSSAAPYAYGHSFIGLTVDGSQRLLASVFGDGVVFDIGGGGDFASEAPFADSIPGFADTALDAIPMAPAQPVPSLGPPGIALLVALLTWLGFRRNSTAHG